MNQNQANGPEAGCCVQGDATPLRDAGTGTGVTDTYDADLSRDATNRVRSMTGDTQSDTGAA